MNSEDGTVSPSLPHAVHSPFLNDEHKTWSRPPCFPRGIHYPRSHDRAETRNHRTVAPSKEVYPNPGFWGFDCVALSLTLSLRPSLQRLFSMFPNGWPGRGLLLLRLGAGIVLTHDGVAEMLMAPEWHGIIWQSLATIGGVLLLIGFFTPMAGVLVVIVEVWTALSRADNLRTCIVLAVVGAALAMLGPGIWSLDARLFGRKRIDIGDR